MNKEQALGQVRHILTFLGGIAVGKGWLDDGAVEAIAGGLVAIIGVIWSWKAPEKKGNE